MVTGSVAHSRNVHLSYLLHEKCTNKDYSRVYSLVLRDLNERSPLYRFVEQKLNNGFNISADKVSQFWNAVKRRFHLQDKPNFQLMNLQNVFSLTEKQKCALSDELQRLAKTDVYLRNHRARMGRGWAYEDSPRMKQICVQVLKRLYPNHDFDTALSSFGVLPKENVREIPSPDVKMRVYLAEQAQTFPIVPRASIRGLERRIALSREPFLEQQAPY
jgi:hypothetical protein